MSINYDINVTSETIHLSNLFTEATGTNASVLTKYQSVFLQVFTPQMHRILSKTL